MTRSEINRIICMSNEIGYISINVNEYVGKIYNGLVIKHLLHSKAKLEEHCLIAGIKLPQLDVANACSNRRLVVVQCLCGSIPFIVTLSDLKRGYKKGCTSILCNQRPSNNSNVIKDNLPNDNFHRSLKRLWKYINRICYDVNHDEYPQYGKLGVLLEDDWHYDNPNGRHNFINWVVQNTEHIPYKNINFRIDNDALVINKNTLIIY